jgi:O-acetyl-ADP-ribose deacetylase
MHAAPHALHSGMNVVVTEGDLLAQGVESIVNPWNRNPFPWWLLLPQGVSGAIKRQAGTAPFQELRKHGLLPLGAAVLTSAGRLPFKGIIHVAGIGLCWRASKRSIQTSVHNAIAVARQQGFRSVAFPLIGAGTGGMKADVVTRLMLDALDTTSFDGDVIVVRYRPHPESR